MESRECLFATWSPNSRRPCPAAEPAGRDAAAGGHFGHHLRERLVGAPVPPPRRGSSCPMFRIYGMQLPHQHMLVFDTAGQVERGTWPSARPRQSVCVLACLRAYMEKGSLSGYLQLRPRSAHFAHVGRAESHRVLLTRHASQAARILVCEGMSLGRFLFLLLFVSMDALGCV